MEFVVPSVPFELATQWVAEHFGEWAAEAQLIASVVTLLGSRVVYWSSSNAFVCSNMIKLYQIPLTDCSESRDVETFCTELLRKK